ncbi:hypothetical protein ACVBEG_11230 [Pseudomonas sp. GG8]
MRELLAGDWIESVSQITLKEHLNDFIVRWAQRCQMIGLEL